MYVKVIYVRWDSCCVVQLINMSKVLIVKIGTFFIFINLVNGRGYLEKMLILRNIKSVNERI